MDCRNLWGNWGGVRTEFPVCEAGSPEQPVLGEWTALGEFLCWPRPCRLTAASLLSGVMTSLLLALSLTAVLRCPLAVASVLPQAHVDAGHLCPALVALGFVKRVDLGPCKMKALLACAFLVICSHHSLWWNKCRWKKEGNDACHI